MPRRLIRWMLLPVYWLLAAGALLYVLFWIRYSDQQRAIATEQQLNWRLQSPRHVDAQTMRLVGGLIPRKDSHFIHFEQAKLAGTVRVCALGDSHTYGDEVGSRHDYPSYLQRRFAQHGYDNVQVLNFGNSWYGFSQTYILWKNVASRFDCDFVLLLPMKFWDRRDTTFNHSDGRAPGYLHARLILENDQLKIIEPLGESALQRRDAYLRPIPYWRYLRYDRHPTSIIDAILPVGWSIINPFYYDPRSAQQEVRPIYRRVIQAIAEDGPQLMVLFDAKQWALYPDVIPSTPANIGVASLATPGAFPYRAPAGHPSSWGNELVADAFFRLLTAGNHPALEVVSMHELLDDGAVLVPPLQPLHAYERVWLEYTGQRLGYFVPEKNRLQNKRERQLKMLSDAPIAAFLAYQLHRRGIAGAQLLPLREVPADGAAVLFLPSAALSKPELIGRLVQSGPGIPVFRIVLSSDESADAGGTQQAGNQPPRLRLRGKGQLLIAGEPVASVHSRELQPLFSSLFALRESGEYLADVAALDPALPVNLVLQRADGSEQRIPWLRFEAGRGDTLEIQQAPGRFIVGQAGQAAKVVSRSVVGDQ